MEETLHTVDSRTHMRHRPFMYIGSFPNFFSGVVKTCIRVAGSKSLFCFLTIEHENDFFIALKSDTDLVPFVILLTGELQFRFLDISVLIATVAYLEITGDSFHLRFKNEQWTPDVILPAEIHEVTLRFSFDKTVFKDTTVDYYDLNVKLANVAVTERGTEIIIRDNTGKYMRQEYYSFPEGLFYVYAEMKRAALRLSEFDLKLDIAAAGHKYQIAIGYRQDWYPEPAIASYANDIQTTADDSLVKGVWSGLLDAFRKYMKVQLAGKHKIKKIRLKHGLMLVCGVKGDLLHYGGTRPNLDDTRIEKEARKITASHLYQYLCDNPEIAYSILSRMDESNALNKMWDSHAK